MRQLALSSNQQEQLRQVRAEYRQRMDNLVAQSFNLLNTPHRLPTWCSRLPVFDESYGTALCERKYTPQMQREVENLRAQHAHCCKSSRRSSAEIAREHCQYQ